MNIIYKATNTTNGKSYVGMTARTLDWRRQGHYNDARRGDTKFQRALRKYSADVWSWSVLCECLTRDEASRLERYFIDAFDTYRGGYNSTTGGEDGGGKLTIIDDVAYGSRSEAAQALGVGLNTATKRALRGCSQRRSTCRPITINGVTYPSRTAARTIVGSAALLEARVREEKLKEQINRAVILQGGR